MTLTSKQAKDIGAIGGKKTWEGKSKKKRKEAMKELAAKRWKKV